jgi:hypothetical protein
MEFNIRIISDDKEFALNQSQQLKNWIEEDEEVAAVSVKQQRKELAEDEAGGGLLAAIQVIIGAALEPFAKTLQVWMAEKTKRVVSEFSIELESADGKKFIINSSNMGPDEQAFVSEVIKRFEGDTNYDYKITESQ